MTDASGQGATVPLCVVQNCVATKTTAWPTARPTKDGVDVSAPITVRTAASSVLNEAKPVTPGATRRLTDCPTRSESWGSGCTSANPAQLESEDWCPPGSRAVIVPPHVELPTAADPAPPEQATPPHTTVQQMSHRTRTRLSVIVCDPPPTGATSGWLTRCHPLAPPSARHLRTRGPPGVRRGSLPWDEATSLQMSGTGAERP